jgi:hypothetical protein
MPQFTINLTQKAVDRLQVHVQRTNDANGTTYTLREWLDLHVRELAVSDELAATTATLQQQAETDARDALNLTIRAERDRLLREL